MYKLFIFAFLCLFLVLPTNEKTIAWNDQRKLTWNDFKAKPKANTSAVALTASGITFGYSVKQSNTEIISFNANVESHFYPNKSWFIKERADNYILAHEQLHFDITELHVRKLREQISKLKVSNSIKNELNILHKNSNAKLSEMQHLYDKQSQHSIHKEAQVKWQYYIKKELKKLEAFKSKV